MRTEHILQNTGDFEVGPGRACVVFYDGKIVYRGVAGLRDMEKNEEMTGDEICWLFSCTKPLTCFAALTLVDNGKLDLNEPVSKYIPEFKDMYLINGKKCHNEIKIINLFTMSAGINYELDDDVIKKVREQTGGRCPTLETVRAIASRPLGFEPGTSFEYSLCHDVLAAVVEACSGMKYYEYIKKTILLPLGMNETFFHLPSNKKNRLATLYQYKDGKVSKTVQKCQYALGSEYESGGAGLISTLDDYIKFLSMLCREGKTATGVELVKPQTIKLMHTPVFNDEWQKHFIAGTNWSLGYRGYKYGLGVYVLDDKSLTNSSAANGTFGWDGAAGSYASVDIENKVAIFYLQHMLHVNTRPYHDELRNAIYADIFSKTVND